MTVPEHPRGALRTSVVHNLLGIGLMLLVLVAGIAGIGLGIYLFGESDTETFAVVLVLVALLCWGVLAFQVQTVREALVLVVASPVTTTVAMAAPRAWAVVGFAVLMVASLALLRAVRP